MCDTMLCPLFAKIGRTWKLSINYMLDIKGNRRKKGKIWNISSGHDSCIRGEHSWETSVQDGKIFGSKLRNGNSIASKTPLINKPRKISAKMETRKRLKNKLFCIEGAFLMRCKEKIGALN